jgi:hypothetical protein
VSRVFVSSAYRDRAVGERVGGLLESRGDEPVDDRNDGRGTAWWNEVVGRIETCELFVAVVSPAYADAHACRLAAKHAAATGLPVVRLDLGDKPPRTGLHPVVMTAPTVRFDPDDPGAPEVLARALDHAYDEALPSDQPVASPRQEARPAPVPEPAMAEAPAGAGGAPPAAPTVAPFVAPPVVLPPAPPSAAPPPAPPGGDDAAAGQFSGLEITLAVVMVVVALVLLVIEGRALLHIVTGGPEAAGGSGQVRQVSTTTDQGPAAPASAVPSPAAEDVVDSPDGSPEAQQLLAAIGALGSDRLPAASCTAGEGQVTCRDPASNIGAVVLTPYSSSTELYDAYSHAVRALSADALPENVGDCSGDVYEGEITWNTDLGHGRDISIADQAAGGLDPASESAGRLFCTESSEVVKLVWTQDPGLLVTATGQPARLAIGWWHDLHLQLACAAGATGSGCG